MNQQLSNLAEQVFHGYYRFFSLRDFLRAPESTSVRPWTMTTGIFIGIADVTQSGCRSTRHPVPASSIPSLIHRFAPRRSTDSASARPASVLGGIRAEPAARVLSSLYLAGAIDTWRVQPVRFAAPGRGLFIDPAVLPASRTFARSRERMRMRACMRALAGGYRRLSHVDSVRLPRARRGGYMPGVIYRGSFRRL